ncbi:NAD-dependent protein deacetylase sirtuin-1 [Protopterus annectens]|uniref:NAD-dependent protein deacetylase sirtuin-1 n=1 Tax=Protopterus annectens TaxID=7888 RepID=UPI001CFA830B|nr:NAD-dependent protein deacetylase sirtuin-1 [Protopterus annectens]
MADQKNVVLGSVCAVSLGNGVGEPVTKKPRRKGSENCPDSELTTAEKREIDENGLSTNTGHQGEEQKGQAQATVVLSAAAAAEADNGAGNSGLIPEVVVDSQPQLHTEHNVMVGDAAAQEPVFLNSELFPNGFHSCESDDEDRASHASSSDWTPRPEIGPYSFVQHHLLMGTDPRAILKDLLPRTIPPPDIDDMTLWQIIINILSEPPKRKKRKDINRIEDVVRLLQSCKKIIVLTGAGVSVSCGIPDFRSRDGIYARLSESFPDLPDPQAMFDIDYFKRDPRPFFKFAKEIYPGQFQPSPCHKFIAMLDKQGKLLRNYTQNIDTLEQVAGIQRIIQCHGSFATASCLVCKYKVDCEAVREDIFNQVIPRCCKCPAGIPLAIMKPDIVFFGENLPEQFHRSMKNDKDEVDLLIVIGSSLKVRPVALIPSSIPHEVPQILINREPLPHLNFDVELLGDCDVIINELSHCLGGEYKQLCFSPIKLSEITEKPPRPKRESTDLPPTPLLISEDSSSDCSPNQVFLKCNKLSEGSSEFKIDGHSSTSKSKLICEDIKVEAAAEQTEKVSASLQTNDPVKKFVSHNDDIRNKDERNSDAEILKKCWASRFSKDQISKRLNDSQYLFLAPHRYIFLGAEVYSDSEEEEDSLSSSSCGSHCDSESCHSPSACDLEEDSSELEELSRRAGGDVSSPAGQEKTCLANDGDKTESGSLLPELLRKDPGGS